MMHDEKVTEPLRTWTPPPEKAYPLVMLSPISCTTPNEPALMYSTRELACAFSTTEPATAASRTTLLMTLSSVLSMYVPAARTMWPTAVLARALARPATVLTTAPGG
jgi:hypothetical protein